MSLALTFRNRQRLRPVDIRFLRRICGTFLQELLPIQGANLGITLVAAPEMCRLNATFLGHHGSTDVITFDHRIPAGGAGQPLHGELFLCVDEAVLQARRFRTTWQAELVRYLIHGILHLLGYDDHRGADRRRMKQAENRLLRQVGTRFPLSRLARRPKLSR